MSQYFSGVVFKRLSAGGSQTGSLQSTQLPKVQDESRKAEQQFRLAEIYRRCGEFELAIATQEKIIKGRLHPDLQRALLVLRTMVEKKEDEIMIFADLLGE